MPRIKNTQIIGAKTVVDFPLQAIKGVPAKVDTGADSSSIWATDIEENDGVLSFVLFDASAPWYTGEVLKATKYSVRSIKNSFGTSEFRYKIPLKVTLQGKKFTARFTLSDRKNNRYPILIGRQTLKGRFVVDVAQSSQNSVETPARVLVLVNNGSEKITAFYEEAQQLAEGEVVYDIRRYKDLMFCVADGMATARFAQDNCDVRSYDLIYFKTRLKNAEKAAMLATIAKREGIAFVDKAAGQLATDAKAHQAVVLADNQVALPKTIMMNHDLWQSRYDEIVEKLGTPFILKDNSGQKGRNNYLIGSLADLKKALSETAEIQLIAQEFIPNEGYYRLVVLGKKLALAMYRSIDHKRSHLYKRSEDGDPVLVAETTLPSEVIQMALRACEALQIGVAGVDLVQDKDTGVWYCLEVNNSPQLVSGAFVPEKMKALTSFFIEEIDR